MHDRLWGWFHSGKVSHKKKERKKGECGLSGKFCFNKGQLALVNLFAAVS